MPKIVILDGYALNPGDLSWEGLSALGALTVYDRTAKEDVLPRIADAEIVFTNKTLLSRETIFACERLRFIGVLATGYNVVDIAAAKERGVYVCNVPAYSTASVAQLTIALLLEICHHAGAHSEAALSGRWQNAPDYCFWDYPLIELDKKTMGIVGLGSIGCATARIARAFGMNVLGYSRHETEAGRSAATYVPLERLFAESDVISFHCPLTPETNGLVNKKTIARMKDGAILLNTSRGQVLCEQDVADALNANKLYALGMDVASVEPISPDNPLLSAKNVVMTPHIAWAPLEARTRLMQITAENLAAFLSGQPKNVVNP